MTGWLAAAAVIGAAVLLVALKTLTERQEGAWVRYVAAQVDPAGLSPVEPELLTGSDLEAAGAIPEALQPFCPAPPFTALVYHHTCGSCRALWAEVMRDTDLASVHLVHDAGKIALLRRTGVYREPAIALPGEVMDSLPSGLALRVEEDWHIAVSRMVDSVADLRRIQAETAPAS